VLLGVACLVARAEPTIVGIINAQCCPAYSLA
jgi:hypothetical protein